MLYCMRESLTQLREIGFETEKAMQRLCETNISALLGLTLVASEFTVARFRFDSVAYNGESNSFIIIEYKNDRNFSVVDQGYSYISTLQEHRADFVLKYNQVLGTAKGLNDFDWTQVRVLFVAPSFTEYQLGSIRFNDLPMELWKIKRYEQGIIQFEQIQPPRTTASISGYVPFEVTGVNQQSITQRESESNSGRLEREIIVYQEEDRLADGGDTTRDLYQELKEFITSLDDGIVVKATKLYIGFLIRNHNLVDIKLQQRSIVVWLNTKYGKLVDPQGIIRDVTHIGHHGNGDCEIKIANHSHMGYIKDLIREHYTNQNGN